ncbi:hypothetical protein Tco_1233860, partial [Tanacetum coccineum]
MYIMTSRPQIRVSVQAPFGGVTDWYPEPGYKELVILFGTLPAIIPVILEVPIAPADPIVAPEAIPFGQPYHTHLNGPRKLLTARKRVGPFPASRLAWRWVSHHSSDRHSSPDFTSDISSGSSSDSLSNSSSVHSLDSSFERSLDSSSPSTGPSRKRCRSPTTLVPSSTPVSRSIAPALVDLPPRKRFRDSYSSEVNGEEHKEISIVDAETVADLGISEGVGAHTEDGIDLGVEVDTSDIREDEEEFEAEAKEALAAYEATRAANALEAESQSQNGSDDDNGNGGNRNGGNGNSENGNPNENERSARP